MFSEVLKWFMRLYHWKNIIIIIFNICVINDFFLHLLVWWIPASPHVLFWDKTSFDHVVKTSIFDKVIFLFDENKNILILCFHKTAALKRNYYIAAAEGFREESRIITPSRAQQLVVLKEFITKGLI